MRGLALLNTIMSFPAFSKDRTIREQVDGLDRVAQEYERVSGLAVSPDIMLGTLVRVLPAHLRNHIQLQMNQDTTYEMLKQFVLSYEVTTSSWSTSKIQQSLGVGSSPQGPPPGGDTGGPMDVDRVSKGKGKHEKSAGKGKDRKGKGIGSMKGNRIPKESRVERAAMEERRAREAINIPIRQRLGSRKKLVRATFARSQDILRKTVGRRRAERAEANT